MYIEVRVQGGGEVLYNKQRSKDARVNVMNCSNYSTNQLNGSASFPCYAK